jgi:hypothetical protein
MKYPSFFDEVQPIQLHDPLSHFLGAFENGDLEITYLDCVKLAGHSCPTVAGAYLMALKGLEALYPNQLPQRGRIKVEMRDALTHGVTGVVGNVISFIAGASGSGGFKGIQGNFNRSNLIAYDAPIQSEVRLTNLDTNESVELDYNPSSVPPSPEMQPLMGKALQGKATAEELSRFGQIWQERVEKILLSKELWDNMITVSKQ